MTLAIVFSLKTMESLQIGVATHFRVTPSFSMRRVSLASSQSCLSVDADIWCKRTLTAPSVNRSVSVRRTMERGRLQRTVQPHDRCCRYPHVSRRRRVCRYKRAGLLRARQSEVSLPGSSGRFVYCTTYHEWTKGLMVWKNIDQHLYQYQYQFARL